MSNNEGDIDVKIIGTQLGVEKEIWKFEHVKMVTQCMTRVVVQKMELR